MIDACGDIEHLSSILFRQRALVKHSVLLYSYSHSYSYSYNYCCYL